MLVAIIWIFGYSVNLMYTGFGIILCAAVMLPKFPLLRFYQILS